MKENNNNLINDEEEEEEKEIEPNPNNIEDISTRRLEQIEARQSNALLYLVLLIKLNQRNKKQVLIRFFP